MENIKFIKARKQDLQAVYTMFTDAIEDMRKKGIEQWDELYPDKRILGEDIDKGQLYIGVKGQQIIAAYVLNVEYDEAYDNGVWKYPNASFLVIHRLCVNPEFQHQGIGREIMLHIEKIACERGIETIRLDTYSKNPYSMRLYSKLGYEAVGTADWRKGRFFLMEKRLQADLQG